jgi:putative NADH-flavin reductase
MNEYRTEAKGRPVDYRTEARGRPIDYRSLRHGQMLTWGFVTAPLQHFHPQNQMARRFRYFGR